MTPAVSGSTAWYTHAGRRRANQDAVLVRRLASGAEVVAVADGMGGHSAGEVASALALEALMEGLDAGASLPDAVRAANDRVHQASTERPDWQGMGTTLVALLRTGDEYMVANVGDSRAYRIDAAIQQLTEDHSYVAEALRSGAITAAEAERSPWRNALTRAIGTDAEVDVDLFGPFPVAGPHAILLCSDGLYKAVSEDVIREYVLSIGELSTAAEALASLAYRRGSDDNITVAVVEFEPMGRRPPTITIPLPIRLQPEGARGRRAAPPVPEPTPAAAPIAGDGAAAPEGVAAPSPPRPAAPSRVFVTAEPPRRRRRRSRHRGAIGAALAVLALVVLAYVAWTVLV